MICRYLWFSRQWLYIGERSIETADMIYMPVLKVTSHIFRATRWLQWYNDRICRCETRNWDVADLL